MDLQKNAHAFYGTEGPLKVNASRRKQIQNAPPVRRLAIYNPVSHGDLVDWKTDWGQIRNKYGKIRPITAQSTTSST